MTIFYPDVARRRALRALDWRWRRAHDLVAGGRRFLAQRDDPATGRCVAYLRDLGRGRDVARRHPDLHAAHVVHADGGDRRVALQAHLLTGQSDAEVAAATGLTPGTVAAYQDGLFDVRDLVARRATDWLVIWACGHTPGSPCVASPAILARLLGYFSGPHILTQALPFLTGGYDVWADTLPAGVDPVLGVSIRRALRLYLLPDTPDTRLRVVRATALVMAAEARSEVADVEDVLFGPAAGAGPTEHGFPEPTGRPVPAGPARTGAPAFLLHNRGGGGDGLGAEGAGGSGVLLPRPEGRGEGGEGVRGHGCGRASSRTGGGEEAGGSSADSPSGVGVGGPPPAGRGSARPAVRRGDGPGGGRPVRGRLLAGVPPRVEGLA